MHREKQAYLEIERAKREVEQAASERLEAERLGPERNTEEQGQNLHQEAMSRAEMDARQKIENEHDTKTAREKCEEGTWTAAEGN